MLNAIHFLQIGRFGAQFFCRNIRCGSGEHAGNDLGHMVGVIEDGSKEAGQNFLILRRVVDQGFGVSLDAGSGVRNWCEALETNRGGFFPFASFRLMSWKQGSVAAAL